MKVWFPYISCATQRELPLAAARKSVAVVSHVRCREDHIPRRPTEFSQLFVGHLSEPRSQHIDVQGRKLNGLHCYCSRTVMLPANELSRGVRYA